MASSAFSTVMPSSSFVASTSFSGSTPAKAIEPIIGGAKRPPSSLVQQITSMPRLVASPRSFSVRTTSSPHSTPKMPS